MVLNRLLYGLQRRGYVSCSRSWSCRHPCVARHSQSDVLRVSASIHFHVAIQVFVFDHRRRGSSRWLQTETRQVYTWRHYSLIVVGIDAHRIALQIKRKLAVFHVLQFVFVQIRPSPDPRVDDVRETFPPGNLKAAIEGPLYRDALAGMGPVRRYRRNQAVQLIPLLLQLFHETFDGPLGKTLRFAPLTMAHQTVHNAETRVSTRRAVASHPTALIWTPKFQFQFDSAIQRLSVLTN